MFSLILHGRRSIALQKLSRNTLGMLLVQNASTCSTVADSVKGQIFSVSYLVDSLGLATKIAESISRNVSFEGKGSSDSVLNLLRSHGFTDSQISSIVTDYPRLLVLDAEKSIGPKLKFLQSRGASTSELTEIPTKVPEILGMRWEKAISRHYDLVKEIIEADKSFKFEKQSQSNVSVLEELGVPQRLLLPLLISYNGPVHGKERFEESLKKVVDMGFDPTTPKFVLALRMLYETSDKTIEEKVQVYRRLGFAVGEIWEIFKKWPWYLHYSERKITQTLETLKKCGVLEDGARSMLKKFPQCIGYSEQKIVNSIDTFLGLGFTRNEVTMMVKCLPPCIGLTAETVKKKTEFVVKQMNWPLKTVALFPQVLGYCMKKRIVPRCNVIKALMSKGLLGSELPSMASVFTITDQAFLKKYVKELDDKELVAELMAIFTRERDSYISN
ncbi:hypothetical protein AALP_AAs50016U000200 [Arabis alpina]|uniref:Mitochondrial transcription termination factor family protein n=1 Tax=Arabis alpina TaxID=50452 RepID=A0A087FWR4_ARAAL|nr:hypothetical protein AALP_AAs50016U000200 [Arabis alpina]